MKQQQSFLDRVTGAALSSGTERLRNLSRQIPLKMPLLIDDNVLNDFIPWTQGDRLLQKYLACQRAELYCVPVKKGKEFLQRQDRVCSISVSRAI